MKTPNLMEYLYNSRWCNFKDEIEKEKVTDIKFDYLPFDNNKKMFLIGTASFTDTNDKYFLMPLAIHKEQPSDRAFLTSPQGYLSDALLEPDFWSSFTKFIKENNGTLTFKNGFTIEAQNLSDENIFDLYANEPSKPLGVEQSNTTLKIGDNKLAFKLERMLDFAPSINAEYEMNEKLMREHSEVMPKTYAGLIIKKDGLQSSSGIVQEFVPNKGDMWNYLQSYLLTKLREHRLSGTPLKVHDCYEFNSLMAELHKQTIQMGKDLSKPDENPSFSPQAVDLEFIGSYQIGLRHLLNETKLVIQENITKLTEPTLSQTKSLLKNWDDLTNSFVKDNINKIILSENKGTINRVHGDYHLGQVMVTKDNKLKVIDFGGEPSLSMEERKQKYINIRDIAGMYRSIKGYLGADTAEKFARTPLVANIDSTSISPEVYQERKEWALKTLEPLIKTSATTFLGKETLDPWLKLEVLRKNLYEVKYEVANRPQMAYIPISGLVDLFDTPKDNSLTNIKLNDFDKIS